MSKFIWFNIKTNKDCTGLFLQVEDDFQEEIKTIAKANDFLKKHSKVTIQLRITINNKKNKRTLHFILFIINISQGSKPTQARSLEDISLQRFFY